MFVPSVSSYPSHFHVLPIRAIKCANSVHPRMSGTFMSGHVIHLAMAGACLCILGIFDKSNKQNTCVGVILTTKLTYRDKTT